MPEIISPTFWGTAPALSDQPVGVLSNVMNAQAPANPAGAPTGLGFQDPRVQGLFALASGLFRAGAPSPVPVGLGAALGQGIQSGLLGYNTALNQAQQRTLQGLHGALYQAQIKKLDQEAALTDQALNGGLTGFNDPDRLEMLGARLAAAGHAGGATLIDRAEKLRTQRQNAAAVDSFRATPGTLGAGVTTSSPQGQAILSSLTGDPAFDREALAAQNEALNANARSNMPARPVAAPNPGLFAPLLSSPYVGDSARSLQNQVNTTAGIPAQTWLTQFDRLAQQHQTAANQAATRQDNADLRRELQDNSLQARREIANLTAATRANSQSDLAAQRTFTQERQLSEQYNTLTKDFRKVMPQFQSAAKYVADGKFDSSGDRALAFQFAKTLDPNDRVGVNDVRDIKKLGNLPERMVQAIDSLAEGQKLPDRVRLEMFQVMRNRFITMNEQQADIEGEYEERARRYMLRPENVVIRYSHRTNGGNDGWGIREKK